MRNATIQLTGALVLAGGLVACGGDSGNQQASYPQQQGYPQQQPTQPATQPTAQPTQPAPQPTQPGVDPSAAIQPALVALAKKDVPPGAKPVGSVMMGNLQQGQTIENPITLQPGKCYSVVASALPPVTEVNIRIHAISPLPGPGLVLAEDKDTGATAVLGRTPNCYKNALPMAAPAKIVVEVAGGSGAVAAQVFEK